MKQMVTMQNQNVHTLKYTDCNQERIMKKAMHIWNKWLP